MFIVQDCAVAMSVLNYYHPRDEFDKIRAGDELERLGLLERVNKAGDLVKNATINDFAYEESPGKLKWTGIPAQVLDHLPTITIKPRRHRHDDHSYYSLLRTGDFISRFAIMANSEITKVQLTANDEVLYEWPFVSTNKFIYTGPGIIHSGAAFNELRLRVYTNNHEDEVELKIWYTVLPIEIARAVRDSIIFQIGDQEFVVSNMVMKCYKSDA